MFVFPFAVALLAMEKFWAARILFFISAGVLAAKLISSSEAYLPKPWIMRSKLAGVAVAILFLAGMLYWVSKEEARSKKKSEPGAATATQKDLQEIKSLLSRSDMAADRIIYEKNPGFSLQAIIRVHDLSASRRKYLFDFGKVANNRWSIYVDEENVFTFSGLTHKESRTPLEHPRSRETSLSTYRARVPFETSQLRLE